MPYELLPDEAPTQGLSRIIRERVDEALRCLKTAKGRGVAAGIHSSRKRLKETRAALRLARAGMEDDRFRQDNAAYRDAARPLSLVRDATALVDALDALVDHFHEELRGRAFDSIRGRLRERARRIRRRVIREERALEKAVDALRLARRGISRQAFRGLGYEALAAGIGRTYRSGRRAMAQAIDDRGDESHHEWRKQGKYLRYEAEVLQPLWPKMMGATAKQAKKLARILGDDHDLAVLKKTAAEELDRDRTGREREALDALIEERRARLRKHARRVGRKLYAEKPKAFVRRVRLYLREWA